MSKQGNQLEGWEVAIIKAMLNSGAYTKQQILAYFSRPNRSINQATISEIGEGHERYEEIPVASPERLEEFLNEWKAIEFPDERLSGLPATHPTILHRQFQTRASDPLKLNISETSFIEGKESFNWGSSSRYCKTLAGMANNQGGYMLFGVKDGSFEIVGIKRDRMEKFDLAKANQFIARSFNQSLILEKGQFEIEGRTIGVLYVHQSKNKPIVCKVSNAELSSGDIYYRYPGETRRIQEPELASLLLEMEKSIEQRFLDVVARAGKAGTSNSAVLDLNTGEVAGNAASFLIDETLLEKVKFVTRGQFKEDAGAPALRLIGEVQPVGARSEYVKQEVIASVTEKDIQKAFLDQACEYAPQTYIRAQPNLQPKWFPVFFFADKANLDDEGLVETLQRASTDYPARTKTQVDRVRSKALPAGPPHPNTVRDEIEKLYGSEILIIDNEDQANAFLKALRIIDPDKIELARALSVLRTLWMRFGDVTRLRSNFRNAITYIDTAYFGPKFFT